MEGFNYGLGATKVTLNGKDLSIVSDLGANAVGKNLFNEGVYFSHIPDHLRGKIAETKREPYDRYGFPQIEKVIHNNPKTVVIWSDKTKTIVSCGEDAEFDEYVGFTAAVMKKIFGSNTKVKKIMKAKTVISKKIKDIEIPPQTSFEEILKQTIELRENYTVDENADVTAISVIDDIIELFEKEL